MKAILPAKTADLVNEYFNLKIGKHRVQCPYFQNITKRKVSPLYGGKGSPEEIASETQKLLNTNGKHVDNYSPDSIRYNMVMAGLGIDCSGFVAKILSEYLKELGKGTIKANTKPIKKSLIWKLRHNFRNSTNLSANTLTSDTNCIHIDDLNNVKPGDLLRVGPGHVGIITEVELMDGLAKKITYCHSTWDYSDQYGVRTGSIVVTKPNGKLEDQKWDEIYRGRNYMFEDYLKANSDDRGIRRLKSLSNTSN